MPVIRVNFIIEYGWLRTIYLTEFSHCTWTIFSAFKFSEDHYYYVIILNEVWINCYWNWLANML